MARSGTTFKKGTPKPANSGRKKGQVNKTTEDIRALAQQFGQEAIGRLVELMRSAEFETVQVAAAKEILDRAYGKSMQPIEGQVLHGLSEELNRFIEGNATAPRAFIGFDEEDRERVRLKPNGTQH